MAAVSVGACAPALPGGGAEKPAASAPASSEAPAVDPAPAESVPKRETAGKSERRRSDAEYGAEALAALEGAQIAEPAPAGYDRELFGYGPQHELDDNGCWTRDRVLIDQAVQAPAVGEGCRIAGGAWVSPYDGVEHSLPAGLQIDHLVPLFEAWQSGAHGWPRERLVKYANDSLDGRALVAVTAELNEDKSAAGPEEWMPPDAGARCWYVWAWVSVKQRWGLSYDETELEAVEAAATTCADVGEDQ